ARIDDDLRTKLGPLYDYKEPSIYELKIEAYKLYEEDCKSKGIVAIPKYDEMGFKKAMEAFGDIVKERRQLATYVNDPIRKENLKNHFKGMILRFDHGDKTDHDGAKIVYKFASELSEGVSDEPHLPYSKRARSVYQGGHSHMSLRELKRELSRKKPAAEDPERPVPKKKKKQEEVHDRAGL
ncbi:DNA topoisomerase 2-binding protein, partial [Trifolium medium]|nr:DNA topoisomerase 2-binding protein [Trifolium medium]